MTSSLPYVPETTTTAAPTTPPRACSGCDVGEEWVWRCSFTIRSQQISLAKSLQIRKLASANSGENLSVTNLNFQMQRRSRPMVSEPMRDLHLQERTGKRRLHSDDVRWNHVRKGIPPRTEGWRMLPRVWYVTRAQLVSYQFSQLFYFVWDAVQLKTLS